MFLGCDPELFLTDAAGGLVSAIGLIGGTKEFPRDIPIGDGFAVQEDNVALEFNTPPANSKELFVRQIDRVRAWLADYVGQQGLHLAHSSSEVFPMEQLMSPQAFEFGCDPDFNAWDGGCMNAKPSSPDRCLRSAGGHIHIGHEFKNAEEKMRFIRFMDLCAGVPSVLMDVNGARRRQLYGKPGAFRFKRYGVEYRTLSNFWVFNDKTVAWAWDATQDALNRCLNNTINIDAERTAIMQTIMNNDASQASQLVDKYNLAVA